MDEFDRNTKQQERNVIFFPNICVIFVQNGYGETVNILDANQLTQKWLSMSNDEFFKLYGFNWVPPVWLQDRIKNQWQRRSQYGA